MSASVGTALDDGMDTRTPYLHSTHRPEEVARRAARTSLGACLCACRARARHPAVRACTCSSRTGGQPSDPESRLRRYLCARLFSPPRRRACTPSPPHAACAAARAAPPASAQPARGAGGRGRTSQHQSASDRARAPPALASVALALSEARTRAREGERGRDVLCPGVAALQLAARFARELVDELLQRLSSAPSVQSRTEDGLRCRFRHLDDWSAVAAPKKWHGRVRDLQPRFN